MIPELLVRATGRMKLPFTKMKNTKRNRFVIGGVRAQWESRVLF